MPKRPLVSAALASASAVSTEMRRARVDQPRDIQARLRAANIGVSVSSKSSAQLDFGRRGLTQVVRASVHYFNTAEEIGTFCDILAGRK